MHVQQFAQLGGKTLRVLQVLHTQGAAGDLVFVGGANTPAGGADFFDAALFALGFAGNVECRVERQDQRAGLADTQARTHFHTRLLQAFNFFKQLGCRQHHTVADVALDACTHDAAGDQVQRRFDAIDDECVPCVVAALEAHHTLGAFGQPIHQLAFAFVTPLGAHHHDITACYLSACVVHLDVPEIK